MKKQMMASMCTLAVLAACSETSEELVPEVKGEGVYATIEQPVSVDTKSLAYENGKLVFTWAEGEKVVVFGNKDAASFNSLTSGGKSTKLESEGFTLKDNVNYYACLPAYTIPAATQSTSVPVTFMGQRQTANGNSDHLKSFDYACASATKAAGENSISFELKNQVAWIVLDHTFTDATNNVTSVTINADADEDLFVTKGTLDVTTSTITEGTKDCKITLNLGEEGGNGLSFAAGEAFRGFFTLNPVDLSGKTLTFTATTKSGETVTLGTFTKASANLTKNLAVRIQTSGSAKVATVDGKEYSTLSAALAAASEGATISVVSDVTTEKVLIDKSVTFDLGGNTVTADDDVFYIAEDGLTVNFKNGNIVSTKEGGLFFKQGCQNENITFDNCNITGVEGAIATSTLTGSTITINGGTFTSSNNAVILTNGNKRMYPYDETNTALRENPNTIIINGGTFKGQMSDEAYNKNSIACGIYAAWKDNIIVNDGTFDIERGVGVLCRGGKVTIKGGTFTTTDPDTKKGCVGDSRIVVPCQTVYVDKASQYPDYENATIEISGGKFSDDSCKDYLAEGYGIGRTYIESKNVWYTEVAEAVSEYDGMKYSSLQTAIEASEDATKEITILKDMEVSQLTVYLENKVTINLNGKNVNITGYEPNCTGVNIEGGSLTIKGSGSFGDSAQKNVNPLFYVNVGASLTIEGDASYYSANVCAYAYHWNSKIYINGGKWYGSETYTLNKYDTNQEAIISVTGGEFYKYNPAASHSENPVANFVADGYGVVKDGDWYKVVKATEVTDESGLSSAIGSSSKTPVMVNTTVELGTSFSIYGGNTLSVGANGVITPSSSFKSNVSEVVSTANKQGVINIEGEGTINGPSNSTATAGSQAIMVQGSTLSSATPLTVNLYGNLSVNGGSGSAGNHAITVTNGTLNIYGGYYYSGKDKDGTCEVIYLRDIWARNPRKQICNIYGGVFDSEVENNPILLNKVNNLTTAEFHVYGGTFVGFNPADNTADGAGTNYVADGYVSTKTTYNGKDAWVVTKAK